MAKHAAMMAITLSMILETALVVLLAHDRIQLRYLISDIQIIK